MAAIPVPPVSFELLSDLKLQTGITSQIVSLLGLTSVNDGYGGMYLWNASSTTTDDGFLVVSCTGVTTGRWLRQASSNTLKNTVTLSGVILQTAYPITFTSALPVVPAGIIIQAYSSGAAVISWISNITTTGFTANFINALTVGTNNITIFYLVIKQ